MHLTKSQLETYDRDGFLILPDLVSREEIALVRGDLARSCAVNDDRVIREKGTSDVRMIYGLHDLEGPTGSQAIADLSRSPRLLQTAMDVLDDRAYLFHTKCNMKPAITGQIWQWHQDMGVWHVDGCPEPRLVTTLLMLDEATQLGGCLYFVRGSHREPYIDAPYDDSIAATQLKAIPLAQMSDMVSRLGEPVPIVGGPGTAVLFHPHLIHGSGHNMSTHDRWQLYFVYNAVSNVMSDVAKPRPQWKAARNRPALTLREKDSILEPA